LAQINGAQGDSPSSWLTGEWMSKLAASVELMTEGLPTLRLGSPLLAGAPDMPGGVLWYAIPLNMAPGAVVYIGAPEESWLHIGNFAMLAAGVTEVSTEDARSTYLEIVTQATSGLAQAISARLGESVSSLPAKQIQLGQEGLGEAAALNPIEVSLGDQPPQKVYIGWSHHLESALAPAALAALESAGTGSTPERQGEQHGKSTTLDLLMEVELPVSVSFGRAQLPLRDVLKLNSGSIVELNRTITDPVEIIVNNCVIARGEVVVVDGNYGVRIQHVISREERLRTLK
jgi:flagellar motor switch protein FliN/FliY